MNERTVVIAYDNHKVKACAMIALGISVWHFGDATMKIHFGSKPNG